MTETQQHLSALFLPGEETYFGWNNGSIFRETASGTLTDINSLGMEYMYINPLSGKKLDSNVTAYRSWLLEFDEIALNTQLAYIAVLEKFIPIRSVTYSGGKSYHAVISLSDDMGWPIGPKGVEGYSNLFARLVEAAEAVIGHSGCIDRSNRNCSRYTRIAGGLNNKTMQRQTLLRIGALITSEALMGFIEANAAALTKKPPTAAISPEAVYTGTFERTISTQSHLKGLRNKLMLPQYWAKPAGNRIHIFNAALWAIDTTGVQCEELLQFINKYTVPILEQVGYTNAHKRVENAIKGAYTWKRLK